MKLAPFASGLVLAAVLAVGQGPAAYAQSHSNSNNNKVKPASTQQNFVTINDGDTLDGIATAHQTTYVRLYDANTSIQDPDIIYPGNKVRIPNAKEQLPNRPLPTPPAPVVALPAQSAPAAPAAVTTHPTAVSLPTSSGPVAGCGDNSYAQFIYSHESGCRTTAMSPNGCYGIGQACPASKIAYCGADYACQNAYFTAYAGKYGGWAGAYAFWTSHGWW